MWGYYATKGGWIWVLLETIDLITVNFSGEWGMLQINSLLEVFVYQNY